MNEGPSSTARLVAAGVAFQSTHPRHAHLVPPEAGALSRRFAEERRGSSRWDRAVVALRERLTVPGLTLQYVLRKRRIEQIVRASGCRQLVVAGAGLDTLAMRLSGEMTCIEIDHPATQAVKRDVAGSGSGLEFLSVDLSRSSINDALQTAKTFRSNEPVVFVIEAVLLYLHEAEVRRVFQQLRAYDARIVFTFWEPRQPINFQNATPLADWWLRAHGEPGRWAIAPDDVREFLASEGFALGELARDVDFHDGYRAARGEHIAVARRHE